MSSTIANRIIATIVLVFVFASTAHAGSVIFVDDDAPPGGDGQSWDTAYRFLQDGLSHASGSALALEGGGGVSEIHVAQGTYKPDRDEANPNGTGDRSATFQLISNLALIGGYAGIGADDPYAQDFELYETILSGDLLGNDEPEYINYGDNSFHVLTGSGAKESVLLEGISIQSGHAGGSNCQFPGNHGAGIFLDGGTIQLNDCTLRLNQACGSAGGIFLFHTTGVVMNRCNFVDNRATGVGGQGGAILSSIGELIISECTFVNNSSSAGGAISVFQCPLQIYATSFEENFVINVGGAVFFNSSSGTIIKCEFVGNHASNVGGAFFFINGDSLLLADSNFSNNSAGDGSGAVRINGPGDYQCINCTFSDNHSEGRAGAMSLGDSSARVFDSSFSGNSAGEEGGAMIIGGSVSGGDGNSVLYRCTFQDNIADRGGAIAVVTKTPTIIACDFVQNSANDGGAILADEDGLTTVINSRFVGNIASQEGGAFYIEAPDGGKGQSHLIVNCTIASNSAASLGGGVAGTGSSDVAQLYNCIFWGNEVNGVTDESAQIIATGMGTFSLNYSCVQGWTGALGGDGNIGENPLFVNIDGSDGISGTEDDDLRLTAGSPCIDAADNTAVPPDEFDLDNDGDTIEPIPFDLDGNLRFINIPSVQDTGNGKAPIVDMGAYETQLVLDLDIKPGSCPNPFNTKSHGMMPAAILGTKNFDATLIDISSLTIARADGVGGSVAPNEGPPGPHSTFDDVGTPFEGELCDCHDLDGDGITDLVMHFSTPQMVEALQLSDLPGGSQVELVISGMLTDTTPFTATDCIELVPPGDMDGDGAVTILDMIILFSTWGSCSTCIDCEADLDGDCAVNVSDLLILIGSWG